MRNIGIRIRELIREKRKEYSVEIIRGKIGRNHVHICVSMPPYISVNKLVQYLKGKTSRKIQQEFPEILKRYWGKHFWAVGYFVRTIGNVADEMIKNYIDSHTKRIIKMMKNMVTFIFHQQNHCKQLILVDYWRIALNENL